MKLDHMWVRDAANEDSADLMRCIWIANDIVVFCFRFCVFVKHGVAFERG